MSRSKLIALLAVTGGLAAAGAAALVPATGSAKDGNSFQLFNHDTDQGFADLGAPGPSVADQYVFGGDISEHQGGTRIGRIAGQCATSSDHEILCQSAFTLPDGQITFSAIVDTATFYAGQPVDFAITGGTGRYRNAGGVLTGRILPDPPSGTDAVFTVRLNGQ